MTADDILATVARLSGFTPDDIRGTSKRRPLVWWRMAAIAAIRNQLGWSYPTLGQYFGDRHFTTIKHADRQCQTDPELAACVQRIRTALTAGRRGELQIIDGTGNGAA